MHFLACILAAVLGPAALGQVQVRGYVRKDGTYVAPHYRTPADGNFYNNWSTFGNVNPYTGRPGTKVSPPANYGQDVYVNGYYRSDGTYVAPHYRASPDGDPTNNLSATGDTTRKRAPRYADVDTRYADPRSQASTSENNEWLRQRVAERINRTGNPVDWRNHTYADLVDMENRITVAERLRQAGDPINWRGFDLGELLRLERRVRNNARAQPGEGAAAPDVSSPESDRRALYPPANSEPSRATYSESRNTGEPSNTAGTRPAEARLVVFVPSDATVWVNGAKTLRTGPRREYVSKPASWGDSYSVRAAWAGPNGRRVERTRTQAVWDYNPLVFVFLPDSP